MATFTAFYAGRNHPMNTDSATVWLRVLRDHEYFEFFLPVIPGVEIRHGAIDFENAKWCRHLLKLEYGR